MYLSSFEYTNQSSLLFEKALPVVINSDDIDRFIRFIKKTLNKDTNINLLDLGVGTGAISIPLYKKMIEKNINCNAIVVDKNSNMLKYLRETCSIYKINQDNITILNNDIRHFVENDVKNIRRQDIILVTRVLHQIDNWKDLIEKLINQWEKNGLLIFTESFGDLYNVLNFRKPKDNNKKMNLFFQLLNELFGSEYRSFYHQKNQSEITAINMDPVKNFLKSKGLRVKKICHTKWIDKKNSWNDYLNFVNKKVFTPIFTPFTDKVQEYDNKCQSFENKLTDFFNDNNWDLNEAVNEELGISFYCIFKEIN